MNESGKHSMAAVVGVTLGVLISVGLHSSCQRVDAPVSPTVSAQCADSEESYQRGEEAGWAKGFREGREEGHQDGLDACPATTPTTEPCPTCDVTTNDREVSNASIRGFVYRIEDECTFGESLLEVQDMDFEIKRRIRNLYSYGRCR